MQKGFDILYNNIKQNNNIFHNEVLQTKDRTDKGFNFLQDEIIDTTKNMDISINNIKEDIKDVRKKIQHFFYINDLINNLNNLYNQQFGKINEEFKNQNAKIIQNQVKLNEYGKTLNLLIESNIKQKEKINDYEFILNKNKDYIIDLNYYVNGLCKLADELKNSLIKKGQKINELANKNENKFKEIREQ